MKRLSNVLVVVAALTIAGSARAEITECNEITSLPATLVAQGVYCMKADLITSITSGAAITVANHSITLDMNGFKLGGAGAGPTTTATGIQVSNMKNFTLRNGSIRGFYRGLDITDLGQSTGHLIEDVSFDGNLFRGIQIDGTNFVVRRNAVINMISSVDHVYGMNLEGDSAVIADNRVSNISGIVAGGYSPSGIRLNGLTSSVVERNLVSKIGSNAQGSGIVITASSSNLVLQENKILELLTSAIAGISISNSNQVALIGNSVVNASLTGDAGVLAQANATNVSCIRNFVDGFTTALANCAVEQGNITP